MNKDLIFSSLQANHHEFWNTAVALNQTEPPAGKWTAAQHVQHINKTLGGIARFLQGDKAVLTEKFGVSANGSRPFEEVEKIFSVFFAEPRKAPVQFVPVDAGEIHLSDEIRNGEALLVAMRSSLNAWTEEDLDRQNCPHPLAGTFTIREMLYFSIMHAHHHHQAILLYEALRA